MAFKSRKGGIEIYRRRLHDQRDCRFFHREEETIRTYRKNLLTKLNAKNTPEAVKKGFEMKLIW